MMQKLALVIYIAFFNYSNFVLIVYGIYRNPGKIVSRFGLSDFPLLNKILYVMFDTIYPVSYHLIVMLTFFLLWQYFINKLRPINPVKFYTSYISIYLLFIIIGSFIYIYIQVPIAEQYLTLNPYRDFKNHPILWLILPLYHIFFASFLSVWFYYYLLKNESLMSDKKSH